MNTIRFRVFGSLLAILMLFSALLIPVSNVLADGNGAYTYTQTFHNATDSFVGPINCLGADGTIYVTYNGVFHYTVDKAGDFWGTGTQTGTVTAVPFDSSLPTYTGHFTTWFGISENMRNTVESSTFSVVATGTDGSTIKYTDTFHMSTNGNGQLVVSFDKPVCH